MSDKRKEEQEDEKNKLHEAMDHLKALLQSGPLPLKDCKQNLATAGLSNRTVERAARKLKLARIVNHDTTPWTYLWSLPCHEIDGEMATPPDLNVA